jgi:primary-amine oxidase
MASSPNAAVAAPAQPLDPLTAGEIRQVAALLRRDRGVGATWRFASIELKEPAKQALPGLETGERARREALAVCWDRAGGQAYRAVVSLTRGEVIGWEHLPGQHPNITVDEWHEGEEMLRAHPELVAALARRGITDLSLVLAGVWAYGAALVPRALPGSAARLGGRLVPGQPAGQSVRPPCQRAASGR